MPRFSSVWAGFAVMLAWLGAPSVAEAACTIVGVQSMSGATANLGRYDPMTAPVPQVMTINLVLRVSSSGGTCIGTAALMSATVPATMTGASANTLRYDVKTLGGANLLNSTLPTLTSPLSVETSSGQTTASVSIQVQAVAQSGQAVPAGGYSDAGVLIHVFDQLNTATPVAAAAGWFVNAAVSPSCKINGAFSANDAVGINVPVSATSVTTAAIQRDYANVVCNAPSDITMSSQNAGIKNPATASGLLTNVIHYTAEARLGSATATLDTSSATAMTPGRIDATTGASGTLSVKVIPQPLTGGYTLLPGRYSDVLMVTLTPR
jgi:hypothetical protein